MNTNDNDMTPEMIDALPSTRIRKLSARLAEVEAELDWWKADSGAAWDKCEERRLMQEAAEAQFAECLERNALLEARLKRATEAGLERILLERGAVFDAMVDAAEDAAGKDVSFNVVVGHAILAALAAVSETHKLKGNN